ncbi:Thioredoxin domain-containing protein 9 [Hondaea fermentalgiana]|uniref:Thioredoxin domain-containing protein 9 n=1 Tax=Hondaea fermentalgiana TaxID=2315210 RepID=A0A2R5G9T4_9STRA|nr:Thioredoxin domain-containing protein 9 [Hondaea fermentalgiana]|eukprot:GBG27069.1 Thioredoxin domain-containing protein 9 [Hondaea fermentalgiana]
MPWRSKRTLCARHARSNPIASPSITTLLLCIVAFLIPSYNAQTSTNCDTGLAYAVLNDCPLAEIALQGGDALDLVYTTHAWRLPFVRRSSETIEGTFVFTGKGFGTEDTGISAPGPLLRVAKGANIRVRLLNDQDAPDDGNYVVNLHTHGLHVSPNEDDVTFTISPGESHTYDYHFPSDHAGGTHWYHPHAHFLSELSTAGGAAGMIVVNDADDASEIPQEIMDVPEIPLVVQQIEFEKLNGLANGSLTELRGNVHDDLVDFDFSEQGLDKVQGLGELKERMYLVNGFWQPRIQVEQGHWYRLRVLNVAAVQDMKLTLYDDVDGDAQCRVVLIAKDGVYMPDGPRTMRFDLGQSIHLHPANRADLLLRCDGTIGAVADVYDSFNRFTDGLVDPDKEDIYKRELIWRVEVIASSSATSESDAVPRNFTFTPCLPFYQSDLRDVSADFNGGATYPQRQSFVNQGLVRPNYEIRWSRNSKVFYMSVEPDQINDAVFERWGWANDLVEEQRNVTIMVIGHVQQWVITANSASHPLHVHVNHFQLVDDIEDGTGYHRRGDWIDTLRPRYEYEVAIRFQPDTFTGRIVLHCHNVDHSDLGSMAQAWVISDPDLEDSRVTSLTRPWADVCADKVSLVALEDASMTPAPTPTDRETHDTEADYLPNASANAQAHDAETDLVSNTSPNVEADRFSHAGADARTNNEPDQVSDAIPNHVSDKAVYSRSDKQSNTTTHVETDAKSDTAAHTESHCLSNEIIPQLCLDAEVSGPILTQDGLVLRSICYEEGQDRCWTRDYGAYSSLVYMPAQDDTSGTCLSNELSRTQLTYELPPFALVPGQQYTFKLRSDDDIAFVDVAIADAALVSSFNVSRSTGRSGVDPFSLFTEVQAQDGVQGPFEVRFSLEWDADKGMVIPLAPFSSSSALYGLVLPLTRATDAGQTLRLFAQVRGDNGVESVPSAAVVEVTLSDAEAPSLGYLGSTCSYVSTSSVASRTRRLLACAAQVSRLSPESSSLVVSEHAALPGRIASVLVEAQDNLDVSILAAAVLSEVAVNASSVSVDVLEDLLGAWGFAVEMWTTQAKGVVEASTPLYLAAPIPVAVPHLLIDTMAKIGIRTEACMLRDRHALAGALLAATWYNGKPAFLHETSWLAFEALESMPVSEEVRAAMRVRVEPLGTFYSTTWMTPENLCAPSSSQSVLSSTIAAIFLADKSANVYDAVGESRVVEAVFDSPSEAASGHSRSCGVWNDAALNWQSTTPASDKAMAREQLAAEMQKQQMMAGIEQQQAYMERAMAKNVMKTLQHVEDQMDEDINRLSRMEDMKESELDEMRDRRLQAMRKQAEKRADWVAQGHGTYREVNDEGEFFKDVKGSERVVIHFYRPATRRCNIIDRHLGDLAVKHVETKFLKVNAEKSPFLVERLKIWMMPSIVIAIKGKTEHTITGFDEFGGIDDFSTEMCAFVLGRHGGIFHDGTPPEDPTSSNKQVSRYEKSEKSIRSKTANLDEDDDWWD